MELESYKFLIKPSEDLNCLRCSQVAREPWQHGKCGRLFCKACLVKEQPCPECKSFEPEPRYFEDNRSKKNIDELHVKCSNGVGSMECKWIGRFGGLQEHYITCTYAHIPCPNGCKDDQNVTRRFSKSVLQDHLPACPNREYECPDCGEKGTYTNVSQDHDSVCKKKLVPCPNTECPRKIQRRGVKRHLETCSFEGVPCKYTKLGCSTVLKRYLMSEHESDDKLHLNMVTNTVMWLKQELKSLKERRGMTLKNGESAVFKMTQYQQKKSANEVFGAPSFSTLDGHQVMVQVYANGSGAGNIGQYLSVMVQVSARKDEPLRPFNGTITIQLLNQLADDNHHVKMGRSILKFIPNAKLEFNNARKTQYLKDDTLYFKVTVETPNPRPWLECNCNIE